MNNELMNNLSPVYIAGVGAVSGAGGDVAATLETFRSGQRNPAATLPFESSITAPTFQVSGALPTLPGRFNNSRTLRLTMHALHEALRDAGIERFAPGTRVGVCLGTTVACQLNSIPFYDAYRRWRAIKSADESKSAACGFADQAPQVREAASGAMIANASISALTAPQLDPIHDFLSANLAQAVSRLLDVTGPRMTIVNACSSGTDAIGVASTWIRAGLCDVAIAGGADELNRVPVAGFWSLGVMSTEPCRPFDRHRTGLNLGEGAGVLVLESEAHVKARGQWSLAGGQLSGTESDPHTRGRDKIQRFAVAGFGAACDAHHLTAPHPEGRGLQAAINTALAQANIALEQIAFINAHGTATQDNDRAESGVIARTFGDRVPFLSTKGYTGHTLGAAGGLEAVFSVLALREGWIPASAGFETAPDDIPVAPVRERTTIVGEYALSTSLAFGGNNAALIMQRIA